MDQQQQQPRRLWRLGAVWSQGVASSSSSSRALPGLPGQSCVWGRSQGPRLQLGKQQQLLLLLAAVLAAAGARSGVREVR